VQYRPEFLVAVPRLFETIYRGVQQKFSSEKGVKKALINFFTAVTMLHVQATRIARGLVIADAPPSPLKKVVACPLWRTLHTIPRLSCQSGLTCVAT
jgi:long-chain acyl-CoA synthetase